MEENLLPKEIMAEMNMTLETFRELQQIPKSLSLETPIQRGEEDVDTRLGDFIEDEKVIAPDNRAMNLIRSRQIRSILSKLTPDESMIVKMYFGFEGVSYTFQEISEHFPFKRGKVKSILDKVLKKLRHHPQAELLRAHYRDLN